MSLSLGAVEKYLLGSTDSYEFVTQESAKQLALLDSVPVGIALIKNRTIGYCNQHFAKTLGFPNREHAAGLRSMAFFHSHEAFKTLERAAYPLMRQGQTYKGEFQVRHHNGHSLWVGLAGHFVDPAAPHRGTLWVIDNIDEQRLRREQLSNALHGQQQLFESTATGIAYFRQSALTHCTPHLCHMLGYSAENLLALTNVPASLFVSTSPLNVLAQISAGAHGEFNGELTLRHEKGHYIECEARSRWIDPDDHSRGFVWVVIDITERKNMQASLARAKADVEQKFESCELKLSDATQKLQIGMADHKRQQEHIHWMSHYDALTGLPNRNYLVTQSQKALEESRTTGSPLALIFLDLDRFKHVNDSLGHKVGDALLQQIAKRLRSVVRDKDTVVRLGGDEFVVLLPGANDEGAASVAKKLQHASLQPYQIGHHELSIAPSMGIALFPQDGEDIDALAQSADVAMYHAKKEGRNAYRFFSPQMYAQSARALLLENAMRRALERDEFTLHYQPQICMHTGEIRSVEALLRWHQPQIGNISPAEFIPVAEESGQILKIGEWVLREAIKQLQIWRQAGFQQLKVAVNLSAIQFHQPQLPELISRILLESEIPPAALELELTEGVAVDDPKAATLMMDALRDKGVWLSMDDFGMGYSSLSQLKRFQIYKLKIDQSFVRDLDSDNNDRAIVSAIIRMAQALGMQTTAEGVETQAQLDFLREQGCDEAQGYWFSRPVSADRITALLSTYVPCSLCLAPQTADKPHDDSL